MQELELILSADGSHTLHSVKYGVAYHSLHGSIQESETVFMNAALQYKLDQGLKSIRVFEMGFGAGLNALMAYLFGKRHGLSINYHGIELHSVPTYVVDKLNYKEILGLTEDELYFFNQMHSSESMQNLFSGDFTFKRTIGDIATSELGNNYDVVFYDAFAPNSQPELWEEGAMSRMHDLLKNEGVLTSYCAKGVFKRVLKAVGFVVESLPGPIGKREMTRAVKINF
jgi:tRNA U34 5-methylaminomethyl-2-thiouridine-forming methyltransferase MnmC